MIREKIRQLREQRNRTIDLIIILYMLVLMIAGRLLFFLPDGRFLNILNVTDYYTISSGLSLLLILFFVDAAPNRKWWMALASAVVIFAVFAAVYYARLPSYTYEEAVRKVVADENASASGQTHQALMPVYRSDKVGMGDRAFLQITRYSYYIYLETDEGGRTFRFDPVSGRYEDRTGSRFPDEYERM